MTAREKAQRENLLRANAIRTARSHCKRDMKAGKVDPLDVLAAPPECMANMDVYEFLMALPKVGRTKAQHTLRTARVGFTRKLGSLTERERLAIASRMRRL